MSAADRVRAYLDAHAASHRDPDVIANLVPDKPNGPVVELRVEDLRALLGDGRTDPPRSAVDQVMHNLRQPGAFAGPPA